MECFGCVNKYVANNVRSSDVIDMLLCVARIYQLSISHTREILSSRKWATNKHRRYKRKLKVFFFWLSNTYVCKLMTRKWASVPLGEKERKNGKHCRLRSHRMNVWHMRVEQHFGTQNMCVTAACGSSCLSSHRQSSHHMKNAKHCCRIVK